MTDFLLVQAAGRRRDAGPPQDDIPAAHVGTVGRPDGLAQPETIRFRRRLRPSTRSEPSTPQVAPVSADGRDDITRVAAAVYALSAGVTRFRTALGDALELSPTDVIALIEISMHPRMTPGELADRLGIRIAGTSTVVDKLVKAGYARRTPIPTDRRTYAFMLSPAGTHAVGWITQSTRAAIVDALASAPATPPAPSRHAGDVHGDPDLEAAGPRAVDAVGHGLPDSLVALGSSFAEHADTLDPTA